jgi:Do/DeqQ family serine protease
MTLRNAIFLLAFLAAFPGLARAQETGPAPRRVPTDVATMKLSFAPIVRRAAPAVVNVYSKRVVRQQIDPFWGMFRQGGLSRDRVEQSLGSGSIVRADGVVLTNHHVIDNAQEIMVVTADRREWPATILLDDPRADLAVLKIDAKGEALPTIAIDAAAQPQVGDLVLAIGDPFGVGQTVTNGIVSALARSDVGISDYSFFIQTDASINPGNSGGPLVDMNGDLIGVNTAILSGSGSSAGIGFAIPAAMVKQVVSTALGGGKSVIRPWIGVRAQALTGEMAKSLGLEAPRGVVVTDLWPTGPAARAGVAQGDVIVSIDGEEVDDDAGINYRVGTRPPGETVALVVRRNGGPPRTLTARTEAPPAQPPADVRVIAGRNPLAGATVVNASPAAAYQYGFDPFSGSGVMVTRLDAGYGQTIGLQPGDFIREINGVKINTTKDLVAATGVDSRVWSLSIERAGHIITARFQG